MSDAATAGLAPHFFQIAYVVRDIEASEAWFKQTMGVPIFTRLPNITLGENCEFRGKPADLSMHLSLGWLNGLQLELIQPVHGDSLYTEFLDAKGPGLHHVAFLVPDYDATLADLQSKGLELILKGQLTPGNEFAYFDCEGPGYSVVEILGFDEATIAFMDQLRQQSAEAG
jgi:methylmalonyl-CoA/ethylmalonyl-CoA epimerase